MISIFMCNKYIIDENNPSTYVTCEICKNKFLRITTSHLKHKHKITPKEYIEKFNISKDSYISEVVRNGSAITHKKMVELYGEDEGLIRWDTYRKKQAESNTYEYKKKKYNWTKKEFNDYNEKRSVTLKNLIERWGKIKGTEKWESYIEKQRYAGCKLEYFQEKYGEIDGQVFYKNLNEKKKQNIQNFIKKYGKVEGMKKYEEYNRKRLESKGYSKISQKLFWNICKNLEEVDNIYFKEKNYEYLFWLNGNKNVIFVDFYNMNNNKIIEFYGDYWHMSPDIYEETCINTITNRSAKEIREYDKKRIFDLKTHYGCDTLIIWEKEYIENPKNVIKRCLEFLDENGIA